MGAQMPQVSGSQVAKLPWIPSQVCCSAVGGGRGCGHCCATLTCQQLIKNTFGYIPASSSAVWVRTQCHPPHPGWGNPRQWQLAGICLCAQWLLSSAPHLPFSSRCSSSPGTTWGTPPAAWWETLGHLCGAPRGWRIGEKKKEKKKFFKLLAICEFLPFCTYFQSIYVSTLKGAGINVTLQQVTREQSHKCGWPHAQILSPNFPGFQE